VPPGVLLVDWRAFCADVEPVMTGLEKDPLAEVHALRADRALQVLSDEDEVGAHARDELHASGRPAPT